jgi:hypothetical protein
MDGQQVKEKQSNDTTIEPPCPDICLLMQIDHLH